MTCRILTLLLACVGFYALLTGCATYKPVREGASVTVISTESGKRLANVPVEFVFDHPGVNPINLAEISYGTVNRLTLPNGVARLHGIFERVPEPETDVERLANELRKKNLLEEIRITAEGYKPFRSPPRLEMRMQDGVFQGFYRPDFWNSFPNLVVRLEPMESGTGEPE